MIDWALSESGQATATWLSALLSLAAVVLAVSVALIEQRRGNAARLAELSRERIAHERNAAEHRAKEKSLVRDFSAMLVECGGILDDLYKNASQASFVDWTEASDFARFIPPYRDTLKDLKALWTGNSNIALQFSSAVNILNELIHGPGGRCAVQCESDWLYGLTNSTNKRYRSEALYS